MDELVLVIGNKNYSSWSLRAWLALRQLEVPFTELRIPLDTHAWQREIGKYSPSRMVPVLKRGAHTVWDSLAILESIAVLFPQTGVWPGERAARARARSLCCEMHAGFPGVRSELPMNLRARKRPRSLSPETLQEVARLQQIWTDSRTEFGRSGEFLFGPFSAADAFFLPVATRLETYGIPSEGMALSYRDTLLELPTFQGWRQKAVAEEHSIALVDDAHPDTKRSSRKNEHQNPKRTK